MPSIGSTIYSERTNILLPVGTRWGKLTTHKGNQQEIKRLHWDIKRKPKQTTRKPIGINSKSNGFNRKSIGANRKSIAMNGNRKESTGNQKAGWVAPSILSAHPSYSPRERKKPCAIYPPWGCHLLTLPFFPSCS